MGQKRRISQLDTITAANTANDDYFVVQDISAQQTMGITKSQLTLMVSSSALNVATELVANSANYASLFFEDWTEFGDWWNNDGTRPNGTIIAIGDQLVQSNSNAGSYLVYPSLSPIGDVTVKHFGAKGDGVTNDYGAIVTGINALASRGGGKLVFPPGTYYINGQVILKSNVTLTGTDVNKCIIKANNDFTSTYLFVNQNFTINDYTTRTDRNIGIENLTFDGSGRTNFTLYPDANYTANQMVFILLGRTESPIVRNCVFKDLLAGWGIVGQGNRGAQFVGNKFYRMGKNDIVGGAILNQNYGSVMNQSIVNISKANGAVITVTHAAGMTTGIKYIRGVRGMTDLVDGEYNVTSVTSNTLTLGAVNSVSYNTFTFDPDAEITSRYAMRSLGTLITQNHFIDLGHAGVYDQGDGTMVVHNLFDNVGETGIFSSLARNGIYNNNEIRNTRLIDVSGAGIEINWGSNHLIMGNQFSNSETHAISIVGQVGGSVARNVIKNVGSARVLYPSGPNGASEGSANTVMQGNKKSAIAINSYREYPCKGFDVSFNYIIDTRDVPLTTNGIFVTKTATDFKNIGLQFYHNQFGGLLGVSEDKWHYAVANSLAQGCWVEYVHPVTGLKVHKDLSVNTAYSVMKSVGGVGDNSSNDTNAVVLAEATGNAYYVPSGVYVTSIGQSVLRGRLWGDGQIKTSDGNKRGRNFAAVSAYPNVGVHSSVLTAFNGDISKIQFAVEHRVTGNAAGAPTSGYQYTPEIYPHYTYLYNQSGHNQFTANNGGRTAVCAYHVRAYQTGNGDVAAYNAIGYVDGQKPNANSFLAQPAVALFNGGATAGANSVYLNIYETLMQDMGFDVAAIGQVINGQRTNRTGNNQVVWHGSRYQSTGNAAWDSFIYMTGNAYIAIDAAQAGTLNVFTARAGQRYYFNSLMDPSTSFKRYANTGNDYFAYSNTNSAFEIVLSNNRTLAVGNLRLGFFGTVPNTLPSVGANLSTGGAETNTNICTRLNEIRAALISIGLLA
jgi:hypothetical protein